MYLKYRNWILRPYARGGESVGKDKALEKVAVPCIEHIEQETACSSTAEPSGMSKGVRTYCSRIFSNN